MKQLITRKDIHNLVDNVSDEYLDILYWTTQQFAAKGLNEAAQDRKYKKE